MIHPIEKRPKRAVVWDIRKFVIEKVGPVIDEYADWYAEHGVSLPDCYALDPTGWTEVLRRIQRAFNLAAIENDDVGEWHEAKTHPDIEHRAKLVKGLKDEMELGFRMFGKHLLDIWDKYGPEQSR